MKLNTTKKYNTGQWWYLEAARSFDRFERGQLQVKNNETDVYNESIEGSPREPVTQKMLPNLSKRPFFFLGGVPPGFKSGSTKAPGADNAFMGCMKHISINLNNFDPMGTSQYYGVEKNCREVIVKAGFYGNGYIELPSHSLMRNASFAFTFNSLQPNALLLMSAWPSNLSNKVESRDFPGDYSVALYDGFLTLRMDAGKGPIEIKTNKTFNDGEYHIVQVIKFKKNIELRVDDEVYGTAKFEKEPFNIIMPKEGGGLFLGGAGNEDVFSFIVPTLVRLNGTIRDVIFNNKIISFTTAIHFENVQMGRSGPKMGSYNGYEALGKSFKQIGEGCQRVS